MKTLEMVTGPHLLWTGSNGIKTYGITVRSVRGKDEVEDKGYQRQFDINDYSIARLDSVRAAEQLGVTLESFELIKSEVARLRTEQK
jgi:hypothetical protein